MIGIRTLNSYNFVLIMSYYMLYIDNKYRLQFFSHDFQYEKVKKVSLPETNR